MSRHYFSNVNYSLLCVIILGLDLVAEVPVISNLFPFFAGNLT